MVACVETTAFGGMFLAAAVLPWRLFYVVQIPDPPAYLDLIPLWLQVLSRLVMALVGLFMFGVAWQHCF